MVKPNDYNRRKMEAHVNLFQTDSEQFSFSTEKYKRYINILLLFYCY